MRKIFLVLGAVFVAGCASYGGRGLVPGQSSAADVERVMGQPVEKITQGGESVWFYTRAPEGRDTYAARIAPDGRLIAVEQRLAQKFFNEIIPGKSVKSDVRAILGPPFSIDPDRKGGEVWDYRVMSDMRKFDFVVEFAEDGIVRKAFLLHDPEYDAPGSYG